VEATVQVFGFMKKECEDAGIEYLNVLVDSKERPLKYVPENAVIEYMEY
jgi:DNA polymerase III subunit epsilon